MTNSPHVDERLHSQHQPLFPKTLIRARLRIDQTFLAFSSVPPVGNSRPRVAFHLLSVKFPGLRALGLCGEQLVSLSLLMGLKNAQWMSGLFRTWK